MNKEKRSDMIGFAVLYIGLTACAFALVYMWNDSQNSKIKDLEKIIYDMKFEVSGIKKLESNLNLLAVTMTEVSSKSNETQEEIDKLQEHCAKIRKEQCNIQSEVSKKKPLLGFTGPLQIEILGPTKANIGKFNPPKNLGKKPKEKKNANK